MGGAGLEGMAATSLHLLSLAALVVAGSVLCGVESAREQQSTHTNNWAVLVCIIHTLDPCMIQKCKLCVLHYVYV